MTVPKRTVNILDRYVHHLSFLLLILFLFIFTGSSHAQPEKDSPGFAVINSSYKKPPSVGEQFSRCRLADKGNEIEVVKASNAKKRPEEDEDFPQPFLKRLTANKAIIMDVGNGNILYAKSPDQPGQPASTIKVLTGLLALEALADDEKVPISRRAARMPRSKIWLDQRKKYCASDLINAVLLASANDASVALAEMISGSEKEFARLMTRKAIRLGARKTICKTASGLTRRGQCSTVRDLAIIFNKAMENQEFAERVGLIKAKTKEGKTLRNHNKALWKISGAEGGKTGYTWAAKQTYVGKFKRDKDELVVAIMGSNSMWTDVSNLVEYGFAKKHYLQLAANKTPSPKEISRKRRDLDAEPEASPGTVVTVLADNKKAAKL